MTPFVRFNSRCKKQTIENAGYSSLFPRPCIQLASELKFPLRVIRFSVYYVDVIASKVMTLTSGSHRADKREAKPSNVLELITTVHIYLVPTDDVWLEFSQFHRASM